MKNFSARPPGDIFFASLSAHRGCLGQVGHHIQNLMGTTDMLDALRVQISEREPKTPRRSQLIRLRGGHAEVAYNCEHRFFEYEYEFALDDPHELASCGEEGFWLARSPPRPPARLRLAGCGWRAAAGGLRLAGWRV